MKKPVEEVIFECLKNILYSPERANISPEDLPPEFSDVATGLDFLAKCAREQKLFAKTILHGDFEHNVPSVENGLAAPLKEIHGILKHLVWQTREVARGDYNQSLSYFGEFSDSFNTMVKQLKERQESLEIERNNLRVRNLELTSLQDLFKNITVNSPYRIIALDSDSKEITYLNTAAQTTKKNHPALFEKLYELIRPLSKDTIITVDEKELVPAPFYYQVSVSVSEGEGNSSILYVLQDVTDDVNEESQIQRLAYLDELTGLPNRRYGMNLMEELCNNNRSFSVGFIDIDYLKYCNDTYGHEMGDAYIVEICQLLNQVSGETTICRIGGDEFLMIQLHQGESALIDELETIRSKYVNSPLPMHPHSFSYGVEFRRADDGRNSSDLLRSADRQMYEYKFKNKKTLDYFDDRLN